MIAMEAITAFVEGPACFVVVYSMLTRRPWVYTVQILVSAGQMYGDILYFGTSVLEGGCLPALSDALSNQLRESDGLRADAARDGGVSRHSLPLEDEGMCIMARIPSSSGVRMSHGLPTGARGMGSGERKSASFSFRGLLRLQLVPKPCLTLSALEQPYLRDMVDGSTKNCTAIVLDQSVPWDGFKSKQRCSHYCRCAGSGLVHSRPEWLYFWFYFVIVNAVWIVVPLIVLLNAARHISAAVQSGDPRCAAPLPEAVRALSGIQGSSVLRSLNLND